MFKALDLWLPAYLRRRTPRPTRRPIDIMVAICDHYEPFHHADEATAVARVERWCRDYPRMTEGLRDADGKPPRYSFFYPIEQYHEGVIERLSGLCRQGFGEIEVHLHHDNDTADNLRRVLEQGKRDLGRHGMLCRDAAGQVRYAFIHGNWTLDNSHPHGRYCGVSNELTILAETGCYGDFTLPSAPTAMQTRTVNSLYYAVDTPAPKSHDRGPAVRVGGTAPTAPGTLLMVQGPLALNWERRKWGIMPRIENADLTAINPPRPDRLRTWLRVGIHVEERPEWIFIKLHTHGALPDFTAMHLGKPMRDYYQHLLSNYNDGKEYRTHFVTAREMANIIHAAEAGETGDPGAYRDFRYNLA